MGLMHLFKNYILRSQESCVVSKSKLSFCVAVRLKDRAYMPLLLLWKAFLTVKNSEGALYSQCEIRFEFIPMAVE